MPTRGCREYTTVRGVAAAAVPTYAPAMPKVIRTHLPATSRRLSGAFVQPSQRLSRSPTTRPLPQHIGTPVTVSIVSGLAHLGRLIELKLPRIRHKFDQFSKEFGYCSGYSSLRRIYRSRVPLLLGDHADAAGVLASWRPGVDW